jgi:hypothetical protein
MIESSQNMAFLEYKISTKEELTLKIPKRQVILAYNLKIERIMPIFLLALLGTSMAFMSYNKQQISTEQEQLLALQDTYGTYSTLYEEAVELEDNNAEYITHLKSLDLNLKKSVNEGLISSEEADLQIRAEVWSIIQRVYNTIRFKEKFEQSDPKYETIFMYYWMDSANSQIFLTNDVYASKSTLFNFTYLGFLEILQERLDELDALPILFVQISSASMKTLIATDYEIPIAKLEASIQTKEDQNTICELATLILGLVSVMSTGEKKSIVKWLMVLVGGYLLYTGLQILGGIN